MLRLFQARPKFVFWQNADGSRGGEVSELACVHPSAVIEKYATVLPGAVVPADVVIREGEIVTADGQVFRLGPTGALREMEKSHAGRKPALVAGL